MLRIRQHQFSSNHAIRYIGFWIILAEGKSTKQIALHLNVSVKTVETHRRNMMEKLKIDSVAELTKYAIREGITSLEV